MTMGKATNDSRGTVDNRESGLNLLCRLTERPSVRGLEPGIFGNEEPSIGDLIEVTGRSNTGKTALLTHWIATCILPSSWKDCHVGGLGVEVAFVNTDQHFCILQLANVLRLRLQQMEDTAFKDTNNIESVVEQSLRRLYVFDTFEQIQLHFALQTVKSHVLAHPQTSVVIIDSLNSYYWQDRLESGKQQSMEAYCDSLLHSVYEALLRETVLVIYTKLHCVEDDTVHPVRPVQSVGTNHQIVTKLEHGVFNLLYRTQKNPEFVYKKMKISKGVIQIT